MKTLLCSPLLAMEETAVVFNNLIIFRFSTVAVSKKKGAGFLAAQSCASVVNVLFNYNADKWPSHYFGFLCNLSDGNDQNVDICVYREKSRMTRVLDFSRAFEKSVTHNVKLSK